MLGRTREVIAQIPGCSFQSCCPWMRRQIASYHDCSHAAPQLHPSILLPPLPLLIRPDQVFVQRAQCTYTPCRLLFKRLTPPSLALLCNVDVSPNWFIVLLLHRKKKVGSYHWLLNYLERSEERFLEQTRRDRALKAALLQDIQRMDQTGSTCVGLKGRSPFWDGGCYRNEDGKIWLPTFFMQTATAARFFFSFC